MKRAKNAVILHMALAVMFATTTPALAETVTLKCSDSQGDWADFKIDMEARKGWFGHTLGVLPQLK